MNIIISTPTLYDDKSACNHLIKDIIKSLLNDGNKIIRIVACEKNDNMNYTLGIQSDNIEYVTVTRKRSDKRNIFKRYMNDNIANIKIAYKIVTGNKADVLFEHVSYSSFWTVLAAKLKKIKIVSMIQDVWPDNAVQSGILKEKSLYYKFFNFLQNFVYRMSDQIICISEDMKDFIIQKSIDSKVSVIYNWGYSNDAVDIPWDSNEFVRKYNLVPNKFYAVYAGNIGIMQNVSMIVKAAYELRNNSDIHLLIIGDGVYKNDIVQNIRANRLTNVTVLPMQSAELATAIYSMAGVNIIPLVKGGIKTAMPSKTCICLSCGKPIILCVEQNSKLAKQIVTNKAGEIVEPDDVKGLVQTICSIAKGNVTIHSQDIKKCFKKYYTPEDNINKYVGIIKKVGNCD